MSKKDVVLPRPQRTRIPDLVQAHEAPLSTDWLERQLAASTWRPELTNEEQLRQESREFLALFRRTLQTADADHVEGPAWQPVREFLERLSASRARAGFSPTETASFVFSLKEPLFALLRREVSDDRLVAEEMWSASKLLDRLGLYTTEVHQKSREQLIGRQQQELLELSTPVVTLWRGILALPLIGTLDSARTQTVMESLLQRIVETGSRIAIIDITGVPTVDTLVAQHLLKTVAAARLMGADCIISGIRPQIAQTIVHLGIELGSVATKATLADAFGLALARTGRRVIEAEAHAAAVLARQTAHSSPALGSNGVG